MCVGLGNCLIKIEARLCRGLQPDYRRFRGRDFDRRCKFLAPVVFGRSPRSGLIEVGRWSAKT